MWRRAAAAVSPWIRSPSPRTGPQFPPHHLIHEGKVGTASERRPFISFVLGGPGSGKGTQCVKIAETFGFEHLSAGDLLRKEISSDCENGAMIREIITEGMIVPSEITVKLIHRTIESSKNNKFLIDGFPRSDENRVAFEKITGVEPDIVLFFDCPEEDMVKRVLSRNQINAIGTEEEVFERVYPLFATLKVAA